MNQPSKWLIIPVLVLANGCGIALNPLWEGATGTDTDTEITDDGSATDVSEVSEETTSTDDTDSTTTSDSTDEMDTLMSESDTEASPMCGDGIVEGSEACDDGNDAEADGCEPNCTLTVVVDVGFHDYTTCVVFGSGHARCWGSNTSGQLGLGHTDSIGDDEPPWTAPLLDFDGTFVDIEMGNGTACALLTGGDVRCWGRNHKGQLGLGSTENLGDDELPWLLPGVDFASAAIQLDVGTSFVCLVNTSNNVKCWGDNNTGELGYGHINQLGDDEYPYEYGNVPLGEPVSQVATGSEHACALTSAGGVICWGANYDGQLGYGIGNTIIGDDESPSGNVLPPGIEATQITAGKWMTCALLETDEVLCWGAGFSGQLGTGFPQTIGDDETVTLDNPVVLPEGEISTIVSGYAHTCALYDNGDVYCWGSNPFGNLGYGNTEHVGDDEYPSSVGAVPLGGPVDRIWSNENATCARRTSGELYCWGYNWMASALGYYNADMFIGDNETPEEMGPVPLFGE